MAEYRPALTPAGKTGQEAEIFLYDTLPGGAGFSAELAKSGADLFQAAHSLLKACPENCDSSCYRCLRSFKNKIEHRLLDRHIGAQLLEYLITGELTEFTGVRLRSSTALLYSDLCRQVCPNVRFSMNAPVSAASGAILTAPILAEGADGQQVVIALSAPLTPGHPADPLAAAALVNREIPVVVENELIVRANLPAATRNVIHRLKKWDIAKEESD